MSFRSALGFSVAVIAAAVGAFYYWQSTASAPPLAARSGPFARTSAPKEIPALQFEDAAGHSRTLADFKGKVVLLNLWATWCAPCREEMPALETLAKDLGPLGLTVVAVNHKEGKSVIETFLREAKLTIPVVMDKDGRVAERYQVYALPATFIVNRQGKVVGTVLGSRDWVGPDARDYLGRLLNEPEV